MKTIQLAGGFVIVRDGEFECFAGVLALKASWAQSVPGLHWAGTWILSLVNGLFSASAWASGAEGKIRAEKNPSIYTWMLNLAPDWSPGDQNSKPVRNGCGKYLSLGNTDHWVGVGGNLKVNFRDLFPVPTAFFGAECLRLENSVMGGKSKWSFADAWF